MPSAGWSGRALGDCPPPVPLAPYVLKRGLQIGHLLFGPFCPFRIWGWSIGVSGFDGARDDAAAVASVCMRRCLSVQMDDAGNGALVRLIAG